jgi:hypothetical protein
MNIYTEVPPNQIAAEKEHLISAIFKLLPYKEDGYDFLDNYFESVLQQLIGFNKVSGYQPVTLSVINLLEYARQEDDFKKYRKAVLDACGMVKLIEERDFDA